MLKALMRVKLSGLLASMAANLRGKKGVGKGKAVLIGLLFLYVAACFLFLFFSMFSSMAEPFQAAGLGWLYFALFAIVCFAMMFVFSVFAAKSQLYEARDNELLLAMPIPPGNILLSRMFSLYIINLVTGLVIAIPALVAWLISCPMSAAGVAAFVLLCLLLPLFSLALSSLFGWLLHLISSRIRNKTVFSLAFSLAFLAIYFYGISQMNTMIAKVATMGGQLAGSLAPVKPLYWIGRGVAEGDMLSTGLFCLVLVIPFILAYAILAATFLRTATVSRGAAKVKYTEKAVESSSPFAALCRREMGRFTSSAGYMLNAGLGLVLILAAAVLLVIKRDTVMELMSSMPGMDTFIIHILPLALCFMCSTVTITASSVSLEGNTLWIAKTLPVDTRTILSAKLMPQICLSLPPVVLCQAASIYVLRPSGLALLSTLVLPPAFAVLQAALGLWANLRHCRLDWINEMQAVKSGMAVLITMLLDMALAGIPIVCSIFLKSEFTVDIFVALYSLFIVLLAFFSWRIVMWRGPKWFNKL